MAKKLVDISVGLTRASGAPQSKRVNGKGKRVKPGDVASLSQKSRSGPERRVARPTLLSGGNPQFAKAYGDAPVQAYIAAMSGGGPGWKRDVGHRLDAIIVRDVSGVRKAVKWNSPLYGAKDPGQGWFLSIHCFTKYIKVAFFRGTSLRPVPPGGSKQKEVRYLDIYEDWGGPQDEAQLVRWVRQASRLPGWGGV